MIINLCNFSFILIFLYYDIFFLFLNFNNIVIELELNVYVINWFFFFVKFSLKIKYRRDFSTKMHGHTNQLEAFYFRTKWNFCRSSAQCGSTAQTDAFLLRLPKRRSSDVSRLVSRTAKRGRFWSSEIFTLKKYTKFYAIVFFSRKNNYVIKHDPTIIFDEFSPFL